MCSFRAIARILRKCYHVRFSTNSKSHKITNRASIVMKIVTLKGLWLFHWCRKFHIDISSRLWVIGVWNVENWTDTPGRQLKITFLDVLDSSEYSDTNISNFFFHGNIASSMRKQKRPDIINDPPVGRNLY